MLWPTGFAGNGRRATRWCVFEFTRDKKVYVNYDCLYIDDARFGPSFIKMCSYAPWGMKLCVNGRGRPGASRRVVWDR